MMRFTRKWRGAISVFLICILIPMVIFEGLIIDSTKLISAKSVAEDAGELAMNGVLADYNTVIKDVYGLFVISETQEELQANLEKYYKETINAANIEADNSLAAALENASTFLNLSADVTGTYEPASSLNNNEVLEAEILQYIKYRGLVSIGTGLLDKISAFSSLDQQQQAVSDKLDYDEQLDDVQDALQAAYDAMNELIDNPIDSVTLLSNLDIIKRNYTTICEYLVDYQYVNSKYAGASEYPRTGDVDVTVGSATKAEIREFLDGFLEDYNNTTGKFPSWEETMDSLASEIKNGSTNPRNFDLLQAAWESRDIDPSGTLTNEQYIDKVANYLEYYNQNYTDDEDYNEDFKTLHQLIAGVDLVNWQMADLESAYEATLKGKINSLASEVRGTMSLVDGDITERITALENAITDLKKAKEEAEKLEELRDTWQEDTDQLAEGDIKTNLNAEIASRTENLDTDKVDALIDILNDMKTEYETAQTTLRSITFNGKTLYNYEPSNGDYFAQYKGIVSDNVYQSTEDFSAVGDALFDTEYSGSEVTLDKDKIAESRISENEFYKYLSGICTKNSADTTTDENSQTQAKNTKSEILSAASGDVEVDNSVTGSYTTGEGGLDTPDESDADADSSDKDVSKAAKNVSSSTGSIFSGLQTIFVQGRNDILLEEYCTEMFSCYVNSSEADSKFKPVSISNNSFVDGPIKSKNYRSEVEYLIYGCATAEKNITAAKTSIFGVRFALNLIYAFTGDVEIKTETLALATAIAGWTGFGVPIVQNVLIIGLALAESVYDTTQLMDGKDVVIYKSTKTWMYKPSNWGKEIAELATDAATSAIDTGASKINSWISDYTTKATDSTASFEEDLERLVDEKTESLVQSAINTVITPFETLILSIVPDMDVSDDEITSQVQSFYDSIDETIKNNGNAMSQFAQRECFTIFESYKESIIEELKNARDETIDGDTVHEGISKKINNIKTDITSKIKTAIKESEYMINFKNTMKEYSEQLQSAINDASEEVTSAVSQSAETIKQNMSDTLSEWSAGLETGGTVSLEKDKTSASMGTSFTLNYKEYMKIFMLLSLIAGHDGVITRIGNLIELNARNSGNTELTNFKLENAYTMVQIKADVSVSTSFLRNASSYLGITELPDAIDEEGKYTFTYLGEMGY